MNNKRKMKKKKKEDESQGSYATFPTKEQSSL
jgi:hypothetical protein